MKTYLSRLEVVLLMDLGSYAGPGFNFSKWSPALRDAIARFERLGLITPNGLDATWSYDGKPDERPFLLTPKGDELAQRIMSQPVCP